jgi:hypothetical protein
MVIPDDRRGYGMSVRGGPDIVENGLVLYLDAVNSRSYPGAGTVWNDLSRNNLSGSLTGTTIVNNPYGFAFTTGSSFVTINNTGLLNFSTASQFTLNIWTQIDTSVTSSNTNNLGCLFAAGSFGGSIGIGIAIARDGVLDRYSITFAGRPIGAADSAYYATITKGIIYNATMVFSGSVAYGYINGSFVGSAVVGGGTGQFSTNWSMFSSNAVPGGNNFKPQGKMYNASAYNRPLSEQEIVQNYNALRPRFGV